MSLEKVKVLLKRTALIVGAWMAFTAHAWAAASQSVDIHVSIAVSKSLSIGTTSCGSWCGRISTPSRDGRPRAIHRKPRRISRRRPALA